MFARKDEGNLEDGGTKGRLGDSKSKPLERITLYSAETTQAVKSEMNQGLPGTLLEEWGRNGGTFGLDICLQRGTLIEGHREFALLATSCP